MISVIANVQYARLETLVLKMENKPVQVMHEMIGEWMMIVLVPRFIA